MKTLRFLALLCLPLALSSCKFFADFVKRLCPEPGSSVTETIGSAGGSLELEDDEGRQVATLEIPAGALETDAEITLSREPSGYARLGDLVSISTDAVSFAKPIVLTLDYSALAASSGLAAEDIGVYCYAEATGLYPIVGAEADSSTKTISIKFTHLGVQVASASKAAGSASVRRRGAGQETTAIPGPIYVELTDQDRETINELTGGGLTAELIAAMDEVWLLYHNGNTNPASETSFEQGAEAVRSWCDGQDELQPGSGWVEDRIVVGYELLVVSDVFDDATDTEYHYNRLSYGTQGDGIAEDYVMLMCTQERSDYDSTVTPEVNWVELFDIYIRKSWAMPVLTIEGTGEVEVGGGESVPLLATLSYSYIDREGESELTAGMSGEAIGFTIEEGPGELDAASGTTDEDGKAEVSYAADWETSEPDNEQAVVKVTFMHGDLELEEQVVIREGADPLIESTSPFEGQTEVETGSAITVRFREAMQTGTVEISVAPQTSGTESWTEGQTLWTLAPDEPLAADTEYMVTVQAGATAVSEASLAVDYVFGFRTRVTVPPGFVYVAGGTFEMGSTTGEDDEEPVHSVTLSSYMISKYEVTQEQYRTVTELEPSCFTGDTLPVEQVSWYDAVAFCNELSTLEGLDECYVIAGDSTTCDFTKNGYRLPTEAEWEFAARGGKLSKGYTYSGSNTAGDVAWYRDNSGSTTHPVGTKDPNELGIHDMSGNVWEWCWDWYGSYTADAQTDPTGASSSLHRVLRGGSWNCNALDVRSAGRYGGFCGPGYTNSDVGFRVVWRAE